MHAHNFYVLYNLTCKMLKHYIKSFFAHNTDILLNNVKIESYVRVRCKLGPANRTLLFFVHSSFLWDDFRQSSFVFSRDVALPLSRVV